MATAREYRGQLEREGKKRRKKKWCLVRHGEANSGLQCFPGQQDQTSPDRDLQDTTTQTSHRKWSVPVFSNEPHLDAALGSGNILWMFEDLVVFGSWSDTWSFPRAPPPLAHMTLTHVHTHTHAQPETRVIISNSLLSSSYAQQLLNFGGNFQKILSVSLSEIACPDAP